MDRLTHPLLMERESPPLLVNTSLCRAQSIQHPIWTSMPGFPSTLNETFSDGGLGNLRTPSGLAFVVPHLLPLVYVPALITYLLSLLTLASFCKGSSSTLP